MAYVIQTFFKIGRNFFCKLHCKDILRNILRYYLQETKGILFNKSLLKRDSTEGGYLAEQKFISYLSSICIALFNKSSLISDTPKYSFILVSSSVILAAGIVDALLSNALKRTICLVRCVDLKFKEKNKKPYLTENP